MKSLYAIVQKLNVVKNIQLHFSILLSQSLILTVGKSGEGMICCATYMFTPVNG